jgi:glycosyltransferase involved in cell wall biosynthesis
MRILHLLASPVFSGPAENITWLALAQRELGHQVSVAVDRKREGLGSEEPAVPRLRGLGLLDEGGLELSVKSSPWAMLKDLKILGCRELDVVHAHFTHDHLLARFGAARGVGVVRSIHSPRSLRFSLPRADAYTVPTQAELARLQGRRVMVLPALLAPELKPPADRVFLQRELGLEGSPVVGMVSTFQPSRRHEVGVEAFALLRRSRPSARLVLVGDGVLEQDLRAQVNRLGLCASVTFAGYRPGEQFTRWLQALDEVWLLGSGNDYSGRAAAQARACGVRVVAVDEGGLAAVADRVLDQCSPASVCAASLDPRRQERVLPSNEATAQAVLALYPQGRGER